MALTLVPLLSLPFAGMLIRRAGYRYDAWVLPIALGFHWLLIRGHGTDRMYLFAVTLFVIAASGAALRELGASRPRQPERVRRTVRPRPQPVPATAPVTVPEQAPPSIPTARTIPVPAQERPLAVATPSLATDDSETATMPDDVVPASLPSRLPPRNAAELLDRLEAAASPEQREMLLESLRSASESVAYVRATAERPHAVLGNASTTVAHAWGDERHDGFLVRFDGVAPKDSTVLVVLCDIEDPAALLDESARDAARGSALIVPSDLPGVKRLSDVGESDSRWLARAVFVPLYFLLGDVNEKGRGTGEGENVTGRPA